jgi:hypothetical protein
LRAAKITDFVLLEGEWRTKRCPVVTEDVSRQYFGTRHPATRKFNIGRLIILVKSLIQKSATPRHTPRPEKRKKATRGNQMGQLSPEQIIALLAAGLLGVALVATLIRRIAGRKPTDASSLMAPVAPAMTAQPPPMRQAPVAPPNPSTIRLATSQASPKPSYTAIAIAEAARAAPRPVTAPPPPPRIDYSGEPITVEPNASYSAHAVAAAARATRGLPPLEPSRTPGNDNTARSSDAAPGTSYAAIAVATADQSARHETAPPTQPPIDYSDVLVDGLANGSYTAIAVATAARHH